jgi:hypothetical protein
MPATKNLVWDGNLCKFGRTTLRIAYDCAAGEGFRGTPIVLLQLLTVNGWALLERKTYVPPPLGNGPREEVDELKVYAARLYT